MSCSMCTFPLSMLSLLDYNINTAAVTGRYVCQIFVTVKFQLFTVRVMVPLSHACVFSLCSTKKGGKKKRGGGGGERSLGGLKPIFI